MIPDYDERACSRDGPKSNILLHEERTGSLCLSKVLGCGRMSRVASSVSVSHGFTPEAAQLTGNKITKTYTIGRFVRGDIKLYLCSPVKVQCAPT